MRAQALAKPLAMLQYMSVKERIYRTKRTIKVKNRNYKICAEHNISVEVESCSFGEALSYITNTDLVLTSPEWAFMLPPSGAVIAQTKNLIDTAAVTETLLNAIKEHFPNELNK